MITETIEKQIMEAMRAKESARLLVLRSLKTAFGTALQQKGRKSPVIEDDEAIGIIRKLVKQREDSIEQFIKGQRFDLAAKERDEKKILSKFLPVEMEDNILDEIVKNCILYVNATSRKDTGKVIAEVILQTAGQADKARIAQKIAQHLK